MTSRTTPFITLPVIFLCASSALSGCQDTEAEPTLPPLVAIDPGHPSETSEGASGSAGATEIQVNWAVAQRLKTLLEEGGYRVVLTKLVEEELVKVVMRDVFS